jgi:mono/diheme cytochrome c family protein
MNARAPDNQRRPRSGAKYVPAPRRVSWRGVVDRRLRSRLLALGWIAACLALSGCGGISMRQQPKVQPLAYSDFFDDHRSARQPPAGTVARGNAQLDARLYTGMADGQPITNFPLPVSRELLERGAQRFNIFCAPCHGLAGYGDGEIVQRGFTAPPSFHSPQLRDLPNGRIFDVITNGYGAMYPYGYRIEPEDRWAIVAYIRALQVSQHATLDDVPPDQRPQLQGAGQ